MKTRNENFKDNAGVRVPPPLIFLFFLGIGLWFDSPWFNGSLASQGAMFAGAGFFAVGLVLVLMSARGHEHVGSNIAPWEPTTEIIVTGLYGYSRNPMYLGMSLIYCGLAIAGGSLAAFVTLGFCFMIVQYYVIGKEERYLEEKFGKAYSDYKKGVRRWI